MRLRIRALVFGLLLAAGLVSSAGTASAAYPTTTFYACYLDPPCDLSDHSDSFTAGNITWYNWAVTLNGTVFAEPNRVDTLSAVYDAFHDSTRIGSESRTVVQPADQRSFGFDMGGGSEAGKVTRIRITICYRYSTTAPPLCGPQYNFNRP
jgi:opacity protein-like surface antigen